MERCNKFPGDMAKNWRDCTSANRQMLVICLCVGGSLVCLLPIHLDTTAAIDGTGAVASLVSATWVVYACVFTGLFVFALVDLYVRRNRCTLSLRQASVVVGVLLIPPFICAAVVGAEMRAQGTKWDRWWGVLPPVADYIHWQIRYCGTLRMACRLLTGIAVNGVLLCLVVPAIRRKKWVPELVIDLLYIAVLTIFLAFAFSLGSRHASSTMRNPNEMLAFTASCLGIILHGAPIFGVASVIGLCGGPPHGAIAVYKIAGLLTAFLGGILSWGLLMVAAKLWRLRRVSLLGTLSVTAGLASLIIVTTGAVWVLLVRFP